MFGKAQYVITILFEKEGVKHVVLPACTEPNETALGKAAMHDKMQGVFSFPLVIT